MARAAGGFGGRGDWDGSSFAAACRAAIITPPTPCRRPPPDCCRRHLQARRTVWRGGPRNRERRPRPRSLPRVDQLHVSGGANKSTGCLSVAAGFPMGSRRRRLRPPAWLGQSYQDVPGLGWALQSIGHGPRAERDTPSWPVSPHRVGSRADRRSEPRRRPRIRHFSWHFRSELVGN